MTRTTNGFELSEPCANDRIEKKHAIDITVATAENAAGGIGATPAIIKDLYDAGVNAFTMGNHTWRTTKLYDRRADKITLDEIERIVIR